MSRSFLQYSCQLGSICFVVRRRLPQLLSFDYLLFYQSNNKYIYFIIEFMESGKIIKGYQQKLIFSNGQLNSLRNQKAQMSNKIEKLTHQTFDLNCRIQQKQQTIGKLQEHTENLQNDRQKLSQLLKKGEKQKKLLYDRVFEPKNDAQSLINTINFNFANKINKIRVDGLNEDVEELKRILYEKNKESVQLISVHDKLQKDMMNMTTEYHTKINELKKENIKLKEMQKHVPQLKQLVEKLKTTQYGQKIQIKSLNQNLQLSLKLVNEYEGRIEQLQDRIREMKKTLKRENKNKNTNTDYEMQKYINIMNQNKELRKKLKKLQYFNNQEQQIQIQQYYEQIYNTNVEDVIKKLSKLDKATRELQQKREKLQIVKYDNEQKNILINQLKNKIDNEKYEREREQLLYKTIIDKYNEYFKAIDIKFADIEFESLGLTQAQIKVINGNLNQRHRQQVNISELQHEIDLRDMNIKNKNMQLLRLKSMITNMRQKMFKLERISKININKINKNNHSSHEIKMSKVMENYSQVQEQRNNMMMELYERNVYICQLLAELSEKKDIRITDDEANININNVRSNVNVKIVKYNKNKIINEQIIHAKEEIYNSLQQIRSYKEQKIKEYQTQIQKLKTNLLSREKEHVMEEQKDNIPQELISEQQQIPNNHLDTILQIQDELLQNNNIYDKDENEHINTIKEQYMKCITQILNNHELSLKNILNSYQELRNKYIMLEENTITNMENNKEVDEEMENIVKDANVYKSKLQEVEKDRQLFNTMYEEKCQELYENQENFKTQVERLQNNISVLQSENKGLRDNIQENKNVIITTNWSQGNN